MLFYVGLNISYLNHCYFAHKINQVHGKFSTDEISTTAGITELKVDHIKYVYK